MVSAEIEIILCVAVGNVGNNSAQRFNIVRELSVFNKLAEQLTENTSEIFVTSVGKEASGVGKHSYKACKVAEVAERNKLVTHTCLVVVKPPSRAVLDFAYGFGALEAAEDCADSLIIVRVKAVDNCFGSLPSILRALIKSAVSEEGA